MHAWTSFANGLLLLWTAVLGAGWLPALRGVCLLLVWFWWWLIGASTLLRANDRHRGRASESRCFATRGYTIPPYCLHRFRSTPKDRSPTAAFMLFPFAHTSASLP